MQFKPVPFYSKALVQKVFFSRARQENLARKPLVQLLIKNEKSSDLNAIANVKVAAFAENLLFIGMKTRMKLLNYLYNEDTSQNQRKYVINTIAEQNMAELSKQGFSKAADAVISAALDARTDEDVNNLLYYTFYYFLGAQKGMLKNKNYKESIIAASKYAPEVLRYVTRLCAGKHNQENKLKIFKALSHSLHLGGPASFKELANVYAQYNNDDKGLVEFSDLVLLVTTKEEMHTKTNQWWMQYCKD